MKRIIQLGLFLVCLSGCATVSIPNYIKDDHPYTRTVYADFDQARAAAGKALQDSGWVVVDATDPTVFEHSSIQDEGGREILLFSDIKELPFILGTRYSRVNVYLRSTSRPKETEIEVRVLTIKSLTFMELRKHKQPRVADKIFADIEKHLK